jgi:PAS domain S-box-containing protein
MTKVLRILMLEDLESDQELAERELRKAGFIFTSMRVETCAAFIRALEEFTPDLILADHSLPTFDGVAALGIAQEHYPDIPFIILSGTLGEELAIETLKRGATDYVLKHRLSRLGSSVRRALSEASERAARKQAQADLQESMHFIQQITDATPSLIYMLDVNQRRFVYGNRATTTIMGYEMSEIEQMGDAYLLEHLHVDDLARLSERLARYNDVQDGEIVETAFRIKHRDGEWRWLYSRETIFSRQPDGAPRLILGLAQDVTDHKRLEEQLMQAQKMEAVGRLAGGVAHDFNNLLTAIIGYSQITLFKLATDDPLRREIEEIIKAGERAAALTSQLLAFSRKQVLNPQVLNLNQMIENMSKMVRRVIGEDIELETMLGSPLGQVKVDPGQIDQVLLNLVINARDAMPEGGKITIETTNVYLDEEYARTHVAVQTGAYVMLAISDTGVGMDAFTRARIFEPFFTTKSVDKGTGLGLSTVYGIVTQTGGHIWVYSEVNQGTVFKIYLPRVDEVAIAEGEVEERSDLQGHETVLVVEDEMQVSRLIVKVLKEHGYKVLEASRAEDALNLVAAQRNENIDLLLTDVIMPGMSGKTLATQFRVIRPNTKILFISGYTDNAIVHHGILDPGIAFVQKPFTPHALTRKVREILDQ